MSSLLKANAKRPAPPPPPKKPSHLSTAGVTAAKSTGSAGKRGIGWPWDHKATHLPMFTNSKVSWLFNWELWVPEGIANDGPIEWVPQVRTAAQAKDIIPFLTDITTNRGISVKCLLGFNEPEIPDQANMSVAEAVQLWREFVLPAKEKFGLRLGSPGVSSDLARCRPWLDEFFGKLGGVEGSGVEFLVVHWYGGRFEDMASFLGEMYARYKLPVWLTEFACSNLGAKESSEAEVCDFMRASVPWLDSVQWVERYAFFGNAQGYDVGEWVGRGNNFTRSTGDAPRNEERALTAVGTLYLDV